MCSGAQGNYCADSGGRAANWSPRSSVQGTGADAKGGMMLRVPGVTLVLAALLIVQAHAQKGLVEVASVKRHPPAENVQWMIAPEPGGRLRLRLTPERLVAVAFRVQMDQIVNAPAWARSDMYEILVKVREGAAVNIDTVGPIASEVAADHFQL